MIKTTERRKLICYYSRVNELTSTGTEAKASAIPKYYGLNSFTTNGRALIQLIFMEHRGHFGCPRITRTLRQRGLLVNHMRVERLMRTENLLAIGKKKFDLATTDSNHDLPVYLNLAARMEVTAINQLWVADITYIRLNSAFVFLAVVIDRYSRRVVGHAISETIDQQLTLAALRKAIENRKPLPGLVHHSDRGAPNRRNCTKCTTACPCSPSTRPQ